MPEISSAQPFGEAGKLLFIGLEGGKIAGPTLRLLQDLRPGGVILFRRNIDSLEAVCRFVRAVREAVEPAPLIAIDEEGGRVTRLAPHVEGLPPAHATASATPEALRSYWRRYGALLRTIGVDIDFAPVVDLCPHDAANGIADRSFGTDPERATERARTAMEGLREAGVLPTLKHFPGLGATLLDSHHHLPEIRKEREAFESEDLKPFQALAGEAPAIMIGHGYYPFYAGPAPLAATLSSKIVTDLLRRRIGFEGVAISDDLEMKAVAGRIDWREIAPRAIASGNDMVLVCHRPDRIRASWEAIRERAEREPAFAARCREAAGRIDALREEAAAAAAAAGPPAEGIEAARADLLAASASLA